MQDKCYVVISTKVDATVKEYQPDVEFKLFRTIDELRDYVDRDAIRAQFLFFTEDVVGQSNTAFSVLSGLLTGNDYISVDHVIYIAEEGSQTVRNLDYLIQEKELKDWDIIKGPVTRAFIQEVINGTYRDDLYNAKRKMVVRRPRADYVKEQLKNHSTLSEEYPDDENDLSGIPDEEIPQPTIEESKSALKIMYIAGHPSRERTAFALLAAQYVATANKVVIVESDPDYHLLTEFATKAKIDASVVTVTDIYENAANAMESIRNADNNLVIVECIDRIPFNYKYLYTLLYYNLENAADYLIVENEIEEVPEATNLVVVIPSTITGLLSTCEQIDKSRLPYCDFVGVDMGDLPETHVSSGVVMSKVINDIMSETNIICPVISITSLRLNGTFYDFGIMLGRSLAV